MVAGWGRFLEKGVFIEKGVVKFRKKVTICL